MKNRKVKTTTIRLSQPAIDALEFLADELGISKNAVIEQAVREMAKRHKAKEK